MALIYLNCKRCRRQLHTGSAAIIVRGVRDKPGGEELLVCSATCGMKARREHDRWEFDPDAFYWEARAIAVELGATSKQAQQVVLDLGLPYHNRAKWTQDHVERFRQRLAVVTAASRRG